MIFAAFVFAPTSSPYGAIILTSLQSKLTPVIQLAVGTSRKTRKTMKTTRSERVTSLSIVLTGDQPPAEFRVFTAGKVDTSKGEFLFDEVAAASVMADYAKQGNELMVDYDHASLAGLSIDPAQAGKSAGWFNLEVRNGELWAVNVRWTPPAHAALSAKEWRYMSPAFQADESGRITALINVALTNLPATRKLEPLMAASITALGDTAMTLEEFMKVCKALGLDMSMSLDEAMAKIKGEGGDKPAEDKPKDPPADAPVQNADAPTPPEEDKPAEVAAGLSRLYRMTGKTSFLDSLEEVELWRIEALGAREAKRQVAEERAALELGKRKENAIALTKLGAETPHTSGLATGQLCKRLLDEPLVEQSARVAALLAARGGKVPADVRPPTAAGPAEFQTPNGTYTLSARELEMCASKKIDPAKYAATRAGIKARSNVTGD